MNKSIRVVPYVTLSGIIWQIYTNGFSLYIGESRWGKAAAKLGGSSTMCSTAFDVMSKRGARRGLGVDLDDEDSPFKVESVAIKQVLDSVLLSLGERPLSRNLAATVTI